MPLASDFGTGQVFLSMLWFFLFFIWIWLLIVVFSDLFRSHDLSGWAKAFWVIGIIILPYLGVLHLPDRARPQDGRARAAGRRRTGRRRQGVHPAGRGHQRRARPTSSSVSPTSRRRA